MGEYVFPRVRAAMIYGSRGLLGSVWQKVMVVKKTIKKVGCSRSLCLLGSSVMLSCSGRLGFAATGKCSAHLRVFVQNLFSGYCCRGRSATGLGLKKL